MRLAFVIISGMPTSLAVSVQIFRTKNMIVAMYTTVQLHFDWGLFTPKLLHLQYFHFFATLQERL